MTTGRDTAGEAGHRGIYVIPVGATEIDGVPGGSCCELFVGSIWRWHGTAARIDGPNGLLPLGAPQGADELRRRAGRAVRRLLGDLTADPGRVRATDPGKGAPGFAVTDGTVCYRLGFAGDGGLLTVGGALPPRETDLTVVANDGALPDRTALPGAGGKAICFTPGTMIDTPEGPRAIETLRPGDLVETQDNGAQAVIWAGGRTFSGAHLFAMPHLRPLRIRRGALGSGVQDADLILSPEHRLLVTGPAVRALFNQSEVLVAARDLPGASPAGLGGSVTYIHLMTRRHEVIRANGAACETFHPASADLRLLAAEALQTLRDVAPAVEANPETFGDVARRCLSRAEAALLRYAWEKMPAHEPLTLAEGPV